MANEDKYLPPIHPGEILRTEFLEPLGLSQNRLAREIEVPPRRINEIVHGKRAITADTALRLSKFFGTTAQMWLNLQSHYELDCIIHAQRPDLPKRCQPPDKPFPRGGKGLEKNGADKYIRKMTVCAVFARSRARPHRAIHRRFNK